MRKEVLRKIIYSQLTEEQQNLYGTTFVITLDEEEILTDQHLLKLLSISPRTLYNWRKKKVIGFFKICSRYYYLKTLLLHEFASKYND